MSKLRYRIAALSVGVERSSFRCGVEALDRYLLRQALQDQKRRISTCFVALDGDAPAGYYTLSAAALPLSELPVELGKRLPRYPLLPAVRLGRLAVDQRHRGLGLGAALLADALSRSLVADIAAYAMLVDAKDEAAAAFYRHHGFMPFTDRPLTLFLPLASVAGLAP